MTYVAPWDAGIVVHTEVVSVDQDFLAMPIEYVAERVLRVKNGGCEDDLIANYIRTATEIGEDHGHIIIRPTRLRQLMSALPSGYFELRRTPVRSVFDFEYYDGDNALQPYGGSPPTWILTAGSLEQKARLMYGPGESWPVTADRADAVAVTYDAGYETPGDIPHKFRTGIAAIVGELYKNPDLSNDQGQVANLINLSHFFPRHY